MDVKEVLLPGVGLRFEFENRDGDRIGVVARRTGDFEVAVYPKHDPDQAQEVLVSAMWRRCLMPTSIPA